MAERGQRRVGARAAHLARAVAALVAVTAGCAGKTEPKQPDPATTATGGASAPSTKATPMNQLSPEEMIKPPTHLATLLGLRDLTRAQVLGLTKVAPDAVVDDVAYEGASDVSRVSNPAVFPGHFFLRGDRVAVVYTSDQTFLAGLSKAGLEAELGSPGKIVRSRVGKTSNQHVYPERGVAFSETDGAIDFVEIFAPMTLADYQAAIYRDPGPFTK